MLMWVIFISCAKRDNKSVWFSAHETDCLNFNQIDVYKLPFNCAVLQGLAVFTKIKVITKVKS